MKKKLLFAAYSLDIGGIETALVTLINELVKTKKYDITLVLEQKKGIFLDQLDKKVEIIEYLPCYSKIKIFAKIHNFFKRFKFCVKYRDKFDCAISYATYSLSSSFVARAASKNTILWVHNEYMQVFKNNKDEYEQFFRKISVEKFKKVVFVSNSTRNTFEKTMGDSVDNERVTINNLIDYKTIVEKSKEPISDCRKDERTTFLFVGRLTEHDKKISRLINACELLKKDNMQFRVLIVGDGSDAEMYKKMVKEKNLQEQISFLGKKKNPYPYFKLSDCLVLTSEHEGFAIVFVEAMILKLPIITTKVADSKEMINGKYGVVIDKDDYEVFKAMKKFIISRYSNEQIFDAQKYNENILKSIYKIFD